MILCDSNGAVIFAACRQLTNCGDALEAELAAMEEGLSLALHWMTEAIVLESDSAEAIKLVNEASPNCSRHAMRIKVIRDNFREREITIVKVSRDANAASHGLAFLGRVQGRTGLWLQDYPPDIAVTIIDECTLPVN